MNIYKITNHYNQKWLRIFGIKAMAIGRHIFYRYSKDTLMIPDLAELQKHELAHVRQYAALRVRGLWSIAILRFWAIYLWQWIWAGFNYRRIPYEIEARNAEEL